ncbi:MAG: nitrous oxide reductase accessory protein NosL [Desulfobacterales bacterium]
MKTRRAGIIFGMLSSLVCLCFLMSGALHAASGSGHGHTMPAAAAGSDVPEDVASAPSCPICGMDRAKFAHSRVYVTYDKERTFGACSIHCAAVDLAYQLGQAPVSIQVADFNTHELIDAEGAFWVLGGDQSGVMTRRAKWAFESQDAADAFISQHGGERVDFEAALKAAYEDMYEDTRMIREKRRKMQHGHQ